MLDDLTMENGEVVLHVADLSAHQTDKLVTQKRNFHFTPPGEFAARVGRTIALHVQRQDWRQAQHTLAAAQRECDEENRNALASRTKSMEQRAAEMPLAQLPGVGPRELNVLARDGYETVADLLLASSDDLERIAEFGKKSLGILAKALVKSGFTPMFAGSDSIAEKAG